MAGAKAGKPPLVRVRRSNVHGMGVFATRAIRQGKRIIEYRGERISHAQADRRYDDKDESDNHTFLFIVDRKTVIDAGVDGNDARFINHSCDPNCESVTQARRVFIKAIRDIAAGDELAYDYQIQRDDDDPANIDAVFACRCGVKSCRGTMLWPAQRAVKKQRLLRAKSTTVPARRRK
jgi:SET domain-containing protein